MPFRDAAILLPVVTGLNGLVWAEVVARMGGGPATLCGTVAYVVVGAGAWWIAPATFARFDAGWIAVLVLLNVATSTLWLIPMHGGTRYVSLALIEGAWPVFSILFAWLLFRRLELDVTSAVGGALTIVGAALAFHRS